jgi:hypothetical protein
VGPSGRGGKDCTHCVVIKCETALGRDPEFRQAMADRGIGLCAPTQVSDKALWQVGEPCFHLAALTATAALFQRQGSSADLQ